MNFCTKDSFCSSFGILIIICLIVKGKMTFDDCIFLSFWYSKNSFFSFVSLQTFQAIVHTLICSPRKMAVNEPTLLISKNYIT